MFDSKLTVMGCLVKHEGHATKMEEGRAGMD
jgi:hypothetical protein